MKLLKEQLLEGADKLGYILSSVQQQQLIDYIFLLQKWNQAYNLTAIKDVNDMLVLHILDSLSVAKHLASDDVLDVGTGAGLPGIPLAILFPEKRFVLIDSSQKRVTFLHQAKLMLALDNIEPLHSRIEDYQAQTQALTIISRAFASLQDFVSSCQHLLDQSHCLLAMKGQAPKDEIASVNSQYSDIELIKLAVPFLDAERHLVRLVR